MLPFGGFPLPYGSSPGITWGGKSHSDISGSKAACAYPELIAACHVLPQRPSRAIRQAAYHAEPFRNPHSICVRFLRHFLYTASHRGRCITQRLTLAFFTHETESRELHFDWLVAFLLPSSVPENFKGGDPAAGSPTATLLRLFPPHET